MLAGCGESDDAPAGATKLSFKLTDAGCDPAQANAPAGPVTFDVTNDGAAGVTELEVLDGDTILGEKENLSDGLSGSFTLTLDAGSYTLYCPGGDSAERGTLTVTGASKTAQSAERDQSGRRLSPLHRSPDRGARQRHRDLRRRP